MAEISRIFLVKPRQNIRPYAIEPPLGLMYLASYLRKHQEGLDIRIADMSPEELSYGDIRDRIRTFQPDIVGITALSVESVGLHRIAAETKRSNPNAIIVAGGPHVSAYPSQVMTDENFDYAVIGEGEETFHEFVDALRRGENVEELEGLAFRRDGEVVVNPRSTYIDDLDAIPFPAWDLIALHKYKNFTRMSHMGRGDYMALFTSRACPYKCIYCHSIFGKRFRMRSAENVLDEIRTLYYDHHIREFEIIDDIFNCDKKRAKQICDMIIESGMKIRLTFPNGIRGDALDEELIVKLARAGTTFMAFAVETATPRLQKMLRKNIKLDRIKENIAIARREGIMCQGFFMLGFPTETREELEATVDFAVTSQLHAAHLFVVNAYEGTGLADMARELGKPVHSDFNATYMSEGFSNLTDLSDKELDGIRRRGLRRFWFKPSRVWAIIRDYPDKDHFPDLAMTLFKRMLVKA